jgi:hypothetical protein
MDLHICRTCHRGEMMFWEKGLIQLYKILKNH